MPLRTGAITQEDLRISERLDALRHSRDVRVRLTTAANLTLDKVARLAAAAIPVQCLADSDKCIEKVRERLEKYFKSLRSRLTDAPERFDVFVLSDSWTDSQRDILISLFKEVFDDLRHTVGQRAAEAVLHRLNSRPAPEPPRYDERTLFLDSDHLRPESGWTPDALDRLISRAVAAAGAQRQRRIVLYTRKADRQELQSQLSLVAWLAPQSQEGRWKIADTKSGELDFWLEDTPSPEVHTSSEEGEISPDDLRDLNATLRGKAF